MHHFDAENKAWQPPNAADTLFILAHFWPRGSLTVHGPDALKALEVPEFDGHVCWAGGQQLSSLIKGDVLHRVCMTLQSSLKVSCFIVPHLRRHYLV